MAISSSPLEAVVTLGDSKVYKKQGRSHFVSVQASLQLSAEKTDFTFHSHVHVLGHAGGSTGIWQLWRGQKHTAVMTVKNMARWVVMIVVMSSLIRQ